MSHLLLLAILVLVIPARLIGATPQAAAPARKAATPNVPILSTATVERLLQVGSEGQHATAFGIHKIEDGSSLLSITSNRQSILFSASNAAAKGGRYVPPAAMRLDVVTVSCGDADLGDRWDCARLSVRDARGRRVPPVSYSGGPKTYRNAMGASWTASTVTAVFRMADVTNGFSVTFAGTDGTEFTEEVEEADVESELFTELPPTRAMRDAAVAAAKAVRDAEAAAAKAVKDAEAAAAKALIDAEPEPPPLLRGTIEGLAGDQWRVTSATPGFTWKACELVSGIHKTPLPPLPPGVPVTVARQSAGVAFTVSPVVQCVAKGRRFQGPVPVDFFIAVERRAADFWTVRNLTDWEWRDCQIVVAEKTADVGVIRARGSATVTAGNFLPGPPRSDAAPTAAALSLSCVINGTRVDAVQKPVP